jgi:putative ABC transport system permease protein
VDPNLPVYDVMTMNGVVSESLARRRFTTVVLGIFAGVSLLLAMLGIYGVLSYSVAQRTREMGLRMALGATPGAVCMLVLRSGFALVSIGVGLGMIGAAAATRSLANLLFGITSLDPLTYGGVAAAFLATSFIACYSPASRATKVDPMVALRDE